MTTPRGSRWIDTTDSRDIASGAVGSFSLLSSLGADDIPGLTVVREIVTVCVSPIVSPTAFSTQQILFGAGVITGDAFAASAFPDLAVDTDYPMRGWMFKEMGMIFMDVDFFNSLRIYGDFHSQRKLDEQTEVFMSIVNTAADGNAVALRVDTLVRMLVKLP